MKATLGVLLLILTALPSWAVDSDKAAYIGGTLSLPTKTDGQFQTSGTDAARFVYSGGEVSLPYKKINSIEYGQKAGRRIGVAIMVSPVALLSKKRKHYLTLGYTDDKGANQGMVVELGKDIVRPTLVALEARTGKKVEYESEDAKKNVGN